MLAGNNRKHTKHRARLRLQIEGASRGQAIVLIAVMLVALLGIAAVAIDGGGLYYLKRDTQNAADAAALAGARDRCINPFTDDASVTNAANMAATSNGFENDGVDDWVTVQNGIPAAEFAALGWPGPNTEYVRVYVKANKDSYFAQIVYPGQLSVESEAVALCLKANAASNVRAITACSSVCDNQTLLRSGSNSTIIGGIWSNDNCHLTGHTGSVDSISCAGDFQTGTGTDINFVSTPLENQPVFTCDFDELFNTAKYDYRVTNARWALFAMEEQCPLDNVADAGGDVVEVDIFPSSSSDGTDCYHFINGNLNLNARPNEELLEGLYFVNGNVTISGGPIGVGKGLTIIATGDIDISGGFNDFLSYTPDHMLMFSNANCPLTSTATSVCTDVTIRLNGSSANWEGLVYGPCGECNWSSARNTTGNGAIICNTVDIQGDNFFLKFDASILPPVPAQELMSR